MPAKSPIQTIAATFGQAETRFSSDAYLLAAALFFAALVALQGMLWRRRRARAWPDHLEDLHQGFAPWWFLRVAGVAINAGVLWLGVAGLGAWATAVGALLAGVSMTVLAHRRWNRILAYLGLASLTLAGCSAVTCLVGLFAEDPGWGGPRRWGCVLYGLAVMVFVWLWLGRFWSQQLHEGSPWTTAGRMIAPAAHLGSASAVLALLLAARLAAWPKWLPAGDGPASGSGAWLEFLGTVTLALVLLNRARAARCLWLHTSTALAAIICVAFCWLRW